MPKNCLKTRSSLVTSETQAITLSHLALMETLELTTFHRRKPQIPVRVIERLFEIGYTQLKYIKNK